MVDNSFSMDNSESCEVWLTYFANAMVSNLIYVIQSCQSCHIFLNLYCCSTYHPFSINMFYFPFLGAAELMVVDFFTLFQCLSLICVAESM